MTRLVDLINPINPLDKKIDPNGEIYRYLNSTYELFDGILGNQNQSLTINYDFNVLGPGGLTPTTQANGDQAQFMGNWVVVGAGQATYTLTPTAYPENANIITNSAYYVHVQVSTYSGSGLYFAQNQPLACITYQESDITISTQVNNNQDKTIKLRTQIQMHLDTGSDLYFPGTALYVRPGMNNLSCTVQTPRLRGLTVTNANFVTIFFILEDLIDGTADFNLYSIKAERGKIATPVL